MSVQARYSNGETSRPEWAAPIARELDLVEGMLDLAVLSEVGVATELAAHVFSAGGKRIRPALAILSAFAVGGDGADERVLNLAASAELVHTASLLHDDVVDQAKERRGVCTANSMWGNKLSVLGGDFLLSKGFRLLAKIANPEVLASLSTYAVAMAESEMLQAASEGNLGSWQENYWRIIRGKTASLMSACCECGAILAGADPAVRRAMVDFGDEFGLAFQITDDLLDIAGDPVRTGKEIGTDLANGKFTLPLLLAARKMPELAESMSRGVSTLEEAGRIAASVVECGALEEARAQALDHADNARACLELLPESKYRAALGALAASVIDRCS